MPRSRHCPTFQSFCPSSHTLPEAGGLSVEFEIVRPRLSVAHLCPDQLGFAENALAVRMPFGKAGSVGFVTLICALLWRRAAVILLAIHERDSIGVLLDCSALPKIGQTRALVFAGF